MSHASLKWLSITVSRLLNGTEATPRKKKNTYGRNEAIEMTGYTQHALHTAGKEQSKAGVN